MKSFRDVSVTRLVKI